jgi:hypothetical protein
MGGMKETWRNKTQYQNKKTGATTALEYYSQNVLNRVSASDRG